MYGCESWTIKKAERQRIDALKLWCWTRLLRAPWKTRRSNQSILKEINPEYSLQRLMLAPILWPPDEKTLMVGKIEGRRRRGQHRIRWLDGITNSMGISLKKLREIVKDREGWWAVVQRFAKSRTQLSDWTTRHRKKQQGKEFPTW